jgi:hypothetical protein
VTNYITKLSTVVLKMPVKRLTQKEKESQEEKKANKRDKKNKKGKNSTFDEEQNSADVSGESEEEEVDGRETYSQLSQSSQLFDEEELAEVRQLRLHGSDDNSYHAFTA